MEKSLKLETKYLVYCGLFAALIVVGALTKIPVPIIPFTLQFTFTNLAGILLGPIYGAISVIVYVLLGLIGLPVFASGGGIGYIFKPTFGYLIAFIIGAYVAGKMTEPHEKRNYKDYLKASIAGLSIVYILGFIYFYLISTFVLKLNVDPKLLFLHAFILPLPGDVVACFITALVAVKLPRAIRT
ncbi:MAG: biotin transporter BioY [Eubacteriaceae bacterium]|nr:biotin transporter BioY [Eubacteriaceae bacterium]